MGSMMYSSSMVMYGGDWLEHVHWVQVLQHHLPCLHLALNLRM